MSTTKKVISSYSKSLFQSISFRSKLQEENIFDISSTFEKNQNNEKNETVKSIAQELLLLKTVIYSSSKTREIFKSPVIPESQKENILLSIFPGLSLSLKSFLKVLSERNHLFFLPEITDDYTSLVEKYENVVHVKILTAGALDFSLGQDFLNILKKITKSSDILISLSFDPKLLGGFLLTYNSLAIDLTLFKEFSIFFVDN
jgi:ATP synthase F1 delta subunit